MPWLASGRYPYAPRVYRNAEAVPAFAISLGYCQRDGVGQTESTATRKTQKAGNDNSHCQQSVRGAGGSRTHDGGFAIGTQGQKKTRKVTESRVGGAFGGAPGPDDVKD